MRNARALKLVLTVIGITILQPASNAFGDQLFAEKTPVKLTGAQQGTSVATVHGGETKCTTLTYKGTQAFAPATNTFTLAPTYSGCTFVGLASKIEPKGCEFLFHISTVAGNTTGTTDIVCPPGVEITKTAPSVGSPKCIVHIPPQTGLGPITYSNTGVFSTREIVITMNITNMKYSQTTGNAESGHCETKDNTTGGTFSGSILLTGEDDSEFGSHVGIFLS